MILGIVCTVVLGLVAIWKTLQCRAYKRVVDVQRDAINHASAALESSRLEREEMVAGLWRVHAALGRGDVAAVLAELQSTATVVREGRQ